MVGTTISHYEVLEEISRGGMGIVYRARDVKLNREVALKVLSPELVTDDDLRRRFIQEAQSTASLEHPHIAVIYETDEIDGVTFIAMELFRGESLADRMAREPVPLSDVLEMATEIANGLAHAHEKHIIHRDLKPANIMITQDGHAKVIDFGLAKLLQDSRESHPYLGDTEHDETELRSSTRAGMIMGTVSYMSPEQARGYQVDHRSDVFSYGILLYAMIAGKTPFKGPSGLDTLHSILKEPTPSLPSLGTAVPPIATTALQDIVNRCLEKKPEDRYQSMKDVADDLRAARIRLESSTISPVPSQIGKKPWTVKAAVAVAALALLGAAALWFWPSGEPQTTYPSKPSIAVLYFENNTGDPSLDWLRTALTDMLVTDLSQSTSIEVLGTDRLYTILSEMNRLDDRITSFEVVQEVAEEASVNTVLLGSFVKAGDTIRISARLQDASNGKILTTERVEGIGESSIFPMVDDLTKRIKSNLDLDMPTTAELDQDLKDISTSSVEAYRHYAEGIRLHERYREEEAIPHFEKAVELDPNFAMALAKLGVVANNLGRHKDADEYARRALAHVDRLTPRERYYVEGWHYSRRNETVEQAIEAYETGIEMFPDHGSARHNLAGIYMKLERYDDALRHLKELRKRRMTFPESYASLAQVYVTRGDASSALEVLDEYLERHPESWPTHLSIAQVDLFFRRYDEASVAIEKAKQLGAPDSRTANVELLSYVLQERWDEARATSHRLMETDNPAVQWEAGQMLTFIELYAGNSGNVLAFVEQAAAGVDEQIPWAAQLHNFVSYIRLERGELEGALEEANNARREEHNPEVRREGLARAVLASAKLERFEDAQELVEEYRQEVEKLPTHTGMRRYHYLSGELSLAKGEVTRAIEALAKAASMLPPRGWGEEHAAVWYALGSAHYEAGETSEAAQWFQNIVDSTTERLGAPIPYVRSLYFLGRIHEDRGQTEQARSYYQRFLDYWKEGDLDRKRIENAQSKLT